MKQKKIITAVFFILLSACKKEVKTENASLPAYGFSLQELRSWYTPETGITIDWSQAGHHQTATGEYWMVGISGRPQFAGLKLGYRRLLFFKDKKGQIVEQRLEIIPDALYLQRAGSVTPATFTGRVFVFNQARALVGGLTYLDGRQTGSIKIATKDTTGLQVDSAPADCIWYDNNYVDSDGNAVIYAEEHCNPIYMPGGNSFADGSGGPAGSPDAGITGHTGGGGSSGNAGAPPTPSNLPGETGNRINTKNFIKCFGNIPDNGATMKITVYVQEPWPGTTFNLGSNSVGHTAIGLTKTNGNQSITQVVGFYPDATGFDKMHAPSKVVNNGGDLEYNVSISYTVTADNFQKIADYVANPPVTYDLINFNCTSFVYEACKTGNLTLPDPYSTIGPASPPGAAALMAPAGIGKSIENMKGQSNVNTSGGTTPISKGPCN